MCKKSDAAAASRSVTPHTTVPHVWPDGKSLVVSSFILLPVLKETYYAISVYPFPPSAKLNSPKSAVKGTPLLTGNTDPDAPETPRQSSDRGWEEALQETDVITEH